MSRDSDIPPSTPRRQFVGELATTAAMLAAACTPAGAAIAAGQAPAPSPSPAGTRKDASNWDTSWMDRITAKHRAVFDSAEIDYGVALYQAWSYMDSVKQVFGGTDADASVVVVLRHAAVPMLFNDAMWEKYEIGKETKTTDPRTKTLVTRNIYWEDRDAQGNPVESNPDASIKTLSSRGVIFLGCDVATRGFGAMVARKTKQEAGVVYEELKANLVPGAILMPTGIFATLMAQEKGCSLMKSS